MSKISRVNCSRIVSPVLFLLIWYVVAAIIDAPLILPFPHKVFQRIFVLTGSVVFWKNFVFTFLRVIIAFLLSFVCGFFAGLLSADYPLFKTFLSFPLAVIRVTPIIAVILIALFWFKSGTVPAFTAFLMALPVMISSCEKGFEKNSDNLEKLFKAGSRNFTGFKAFRYIRLPAASPSIFAGAESCFGICWKVAVAGEVLSVPRYAAGTLLQKSQVHLETADTFAVTLVLVIVSYCFQLLFRYFGRKKDV